MSVQHHGYAVGIAFYSGFLLLWALNHLSDLLFTQERDVTIVDPLGSLNNIMMLMRQSRVSPRQNTSRNTIRDPQGKNLTAALTVGKLANLLQNLKYTRVHTGEKPYCCTDCGKQKSHHCFDCGKSYLRLKSLKVHMIIHTGEKPYSCDQCGKSFTISSYLTIHQRTHTGEKPYSCAQCGMSFTQSSTLVSHQRTHTGEKPYSCDQCGKSFTKSSSLIVHQRTHTGEKPHSCDQCRKSFVTSSRLIVHQRTHTGEKPHSCDQCDKSYSDKRSHTSYQIDVCFCRRCVKKPCGCTDSVKATMHRPRKCMSNLAARDLATDLQVSVPALH
uniref:C2H2-type domain-containing protein n=1 Tax=Hucho hucho TaxID=62062 RepID=A0A4W5QEY4_9TELE